jgi:TrmH family RNA methyltransferase
MVITSRQHDIVRMYRRVARGDEALALIDGWHLLQEAAVSAIPIVEVAVVNRSLPAACQSLIDRATRTGARLVTVSASVMDALSPVRAPSGIVAIVRRRHASFASALVPAPALVVVAIGLQDPGNAGAVVRAAEAGGATGVILTGESADPWSWKALRAAMGSTFRLPVAVDPEPAHALRALREAGVQLMATTPRDGTSMYDSDLRAPTAVIFGGEGSGLDATWIDAADAILRVPMRPPVESLNVAVATALVVYEAARQRRTGGM